ncbi:MAG TPA: ABC transporter permease [Clostridiales bacterium]|nr:ABC transporter permease [Clostridiales bacterium]
MITELRLLYRYRAMLQSMVSMHLRGRYKGSVLGFLWTFVNPLMMLVVYSAVFSFVVRFEQQGYAIFLFVGLLPWYYHSQSLTMATACMVQHANLIKKVYFPKSVLPLSVVLANLLNFLFGLVILVAALVISGVSPTSAWLAFPLVLAVHTLLIAGLALLFSVGNVYFRDLEHTLGVAVNMWFFVTPILYTLDIIPEHLQPYFRLNPLTPIIEAYRSVLFYGHPPDWALLGWLAAGLAVFLTLSLAVFVRAQRDVAEYL